jgi:hypothetical protein
VNEAQLLAGPSDRIERNQAALCRIVHDFGERISAALGCRARDGRS